MRRVTCVRDSVCVTLVRSERQGSPPGQRTSTPTPPTTARVWIQVEREASIVYKPHRLPAWCDRVLWHSNMPHSMHPLCSGYFMVAEADSSDHKPVAAVFTLPAVLSPAQVVSDSIESAPPRPCILPSSITHTSTRHLMAEHPHRVIPSIIGSLAAPVPRLALPAVVRVLCSCSMAVDCIVDFSAWRVTAGAPCRSLVAVCLLAVLLLVEACRGAHASPARSPASEPRRRRVPRRGLCAR